MVESQEKTMIASLWGKWSSGYDEQYAHGLKSEQETLAWLNFLEVELGVNNVSLLDVGTGTGFLALLTARLGHCCIGIDLSDEMLQIAKRKSRDFSDRLTYFKGDAERLPFADCVFDVVMNRHLLWTLPNPLQALQEWYRVLKPGGKLLVINGTWSTFGWSNKAISLLGNLMIVLQERKNPWADGYARDLRERLPLMSGIKAEKIMELLRQTGYHCVALVDMDKVQAAEYAAMPLRYRLAYMHERYAISGIKTINKETRLMK